VAEKIVNALEPGGYLVCAHANVLRDDPRDTGFDWDVPFGALKIGKVLGSTPGLRFVRELRTPLYRIQLYRKPHRWQRWLFRRVPQVFTVPQSAPLENNVAAFAVLEPGGATPRSVATPAIKPRLPILMYHRIAIDGPAALSRYCVTPEAFEEQLSYLQENGYSSATLDEWRLAVQGIRPLPRGSILLTFDDGCVDFLTTAWPLIQRYGFGALVFLPTETVGGRCDWDGRHGTPTQVLDWSQIIQLKKDGVEFGSHTASHPMLTSLPPDEIARELLRSRIELEERLGSAITSIAYPYGETDGAVQALAGACGYLYGLTCEPRATERNDRFLALPRLEVSRHLQIKGFANLLNT
jgi:peptidoglycan/xylan/chitin deacetylase (PgdA/CDA1 family)